MERQRDAERRGGDFNRIDVRRPSLKLSATASTVNITELSAFTERGILQATAAVSQLPQRQVNLSFTGRGVPLNILQAWGWPSLPISGDGNLQLTASGSVQADAPLKPTVNGQLSAVNMEKQQVAQIMRNGEVSPAPAAPRTPLDAPLSHGERDASGKLRSGHSLPFREGLGCES
jgi:hypothetical protein